MGHTHSDSFSIGSGGSHTHSVSITTGSTDLWGQVRIFGFGDSTTQGAFSVNSKSLSLAYPSSGKSWGYMTLELDGTHTHPVNASTGSSGSHQHTLSGSVLNYSGSTGSDSHSHTVSGETEAASGTTGSAGSGNSHTHGNTGSALGSQSILGPYVTCYIWKRTA